MQRRSLLAGLAGCLAAGFAPAAIGSGILMPVKKIAMIPAKDITGRLDYRHLRILDLDGNVILSSEWHEDRSITVPEGQIGVLRRADGNYTLVSSDQRRAGRIQHLRD